MTETDSIEVVQLNYSYVILMLTIDKTQINLKFCQIKIMIRLINFIANSYDDV